MRLDWWLIFNTLQSPLATQKRRLADRQMQIGSVKADAQVQPSLQLKVGGGFVIGGVLRRHLKL